MFPFEEFDNDMVVVSLSLSCHAFRDENYVLPDYVQV
jgi:hypothetical protein